MIDEETDWQKPIGRASILSELTYQFILQTSKRSAFIGTYYFLDNTAGQCIVPNIWLDDSPEMLMEFLAEVLFIS